MEQTFSIQGSLAARAQLHLLVLPGRLIGQILLKFLVGGLHLGQDAIRELVEQYEHVAEIGAADHSRLAVHVIVVSEGLQQRAYLPEGFLAVLPLGESDRMRNLLDRLFRIGAVMELRTSLRQLYILFLFDLVLNHSRSCRSFEKCFANKSLDLSLAEALRTAFGELPGGFLDSISLADKKTS